MGGGVDDIGESIGIGSATSEGHGVKTCSAGFIYGYLAPNKDHKTLRNDCNPLAEGTGLVKVHRTLIWRIVGI